MFYVYELRDQTGHVFYVGKGSKRRMHEHERHARAGKRSHTCNKIRKLWRSENQVQKAIVFHTHSEAEAFREEIRLIAYYGRNTLTNGTDGGDGVRNPTAQAREKIAASRRGKIASEATRNRQRLAKLDRPRSEETRAKIAAYQAGKPKPWASATARQNLAKINQTKGRKWTEEQRAKFRASRLGHAVSPETRAKISAAKTKQKP